MNLNDFALCPRRNKKKTLKVTYIQNGASGHTRKTSTITSKSKSTEKWHSESNSVTHTSNTTHTTVDESGIIIAITEGRGEASCEVGISAMNTQNPELSLSQISDTSSYIKVLNKIHVLYPSEILVPITFTSTRLVEMLKSTFPAVKILAIDRSAFRKDSGQQFVRDVCAKAYNPVILVLQHKYYALTATGALRVYLETYKREFYAKESMRVTYTESDSNSMIDVFVADKLELVACALEDDTIHRKTSSLRGILNHCKTRLGSRMLRSTILQPPNQLEEIESRLDCVEELLKCPEKQIALRDILKKLSTFGQVLSLATILKGNAQYCDERHLNYVLRLNSFFDEIEPMKEILSTCRSSFFHEVLATLNREEFQFLNTEFKRILHEDARPCSGEQSTTARCFAIKGGVSDVLDFLRTKYSNRVEEMRKHVAEKALEVGYDLKLSNSQKKGYHMVLQLGGKQRNKFNKSTLPVDFCQVDIMATMVTMKTIKLLTLSNFLSDTATEIIKISNMHLHKLLLKVQENISLLYITCEQVAKFDFLQSLANATAAGNRYVRPNFDNYTEVIDARHPLLDYILEKEPVANNIIVTPEHRLHLITGANGSGKSIYIRQIVLLQIMAQIGCFVPATSATFRICDRFLARIYFEDNFENGASAFTLEMKDIKYFFNVITDRTLIIIDELCRSTAVREGTALAMAICEHLMRTPAFIYFTTHYTYITKLQQLYPQIKCWQMETKEIHHEAKKPKLHFTHKLIPGVVTLEGYGLALARNVWPDTATTDADQLLRKIDDKSLDTSIDKKIALKINLENTLAELKRVGKCDKCTAYQLWQEYQASLQELGVTINIERRVRKSAINSTQNDDVDMTLTQEHFQAEFVSTNYSSHQSRANCSSFTENSYLQQKGINRSPLIINSSISSNFNTVPKQPVKVLQNFTIAKPVNTLSRNYSGIAAREQAILRDSDDFSFVPMSQSVFNNGNTAFDTFTQNIRNIQQASQAEREFNTSCTHNETLEQVDFLNKSQAFDPYEINLSFSFDGEDSQSTHTNVFDFCAPEVPNNPFQFESNTQSSSHDVRMIEDIAHKELSITSSHFMNNLRAEDASTPIPSGNLNTIEARMKYAEACITPTPQMFDNEFKTRLQSNVLTPCTSTTGTKPKTVTTETYSPELPIKKKKLLNSEELNAASFENSFLNNVAQSQENEESLESSQEVIDLCSSQLEPITPFQKQTKKKGFKLFNKRELEQFYNQKRLNAMQSNDPEEVRKYCQEVMNRPSMKQLQASEVLVTARRTANGQCVFDKPKKPKRFEAPFKTNDNFGRNNQINATMFSDANSRVFDEYMEYIRSAKDKTETLDFDEFKRRSSTSEDFP